MNAISHSYTIQPLISTEGKLIGKLFLCLQETTGKFGPNVLNDLFLPNNVFVTCSSSGKMSKELVKKFTLEIIKPVVKENFILMLDSWSGHKNYDQYENMFNDLNCKLLVIPLKTTSLIQPADVFVFLQWKYFAKKCTILLHLKRLTLICV